MSKDTKVKAITNYRNTRVKPAHSRRQFLQNAAVTGAVSAAAVTGFPYISNAKAAQTTTWKVQSFWSSQVGLEIFKQWCHSIVEKTGGELAFEPFGAREMVGNFRLFDALEHGVVQALNSFTLYWTERTPAAAFLSSYPMGLRTPNEWDVFYYGLGGLEIARKEFAKFNMYFVGPIHNGPNIIHSTVPINSIDDFKGRKMRLPGSMVTELFRAAGAKTTLLSGAEIPPAFERGMIDTADFGGPAVNYAQGLHQVTDYISMGPPGFMSIYQPVDLMDLTVSMDAWRALSPQMKQFVESEVHVYSDIHHAKLQAADQVAWKKFEQAGTVISRLSESDVDKFTRLAVPLWFKWAKKSPAAAEVFNIQLDYMMSGSLGYVTPEMIKGYSL